MTDDKTVNSDVASEVDDTEISLGLVGWAIDWADQEGMRLVNKKLKIAIILSENEVNICKAIEE
jgi:hypothetical protein